MLTIFTLVLDGEPWIERHYPEFRKLTIPWRWIVVEGVAANKNCTSWCASIPPRLSNDGTTEYLHALYQKDPRVTYCGREIWNGGKVQMCNFALQQIQEPCILMEIDSDELWTAYQIEAVYWLFQEHPSRNCADFYCRYVVGPERCIVTRGGYGNHEDYEWRRAWRFQPGMRFKTHEPPEIGGIIRNPITHKETESVGAVFLHFAYATRKQMEFRQQFYAGPTNPNAHLWKQCVEAWDRLQRSPLPCRLRDFFPWVDADCVVDHL